MFFELLAFLASTLLYYLIYKYKKIISSKLNIYDIPDEKRKIHKKKTSSIGGILFFSSLLTYCILSIIFEKIQLSQTIIFILLLAFIYFIVGLLDDSHNIGAYYKLFWLFCITFGILYFEPNLVLQKLYFQTGSFELSTNYLNILFTTLSILLLTNALNLADGINGLAVKICFIWLLYTKFIIFQDNGIFGASLLAILLIIFFNIYFGKFFLGNAGVMLLSALVSLIFIYGYNLRVLTDKIYVEEIFILFMVPGIDMFRLFLQRIKNKKDPFSADQNHLHHFLIKKYKLKTSLLIYLSLIIFPILTYKTGIMSGIEIILLYLVLYSIIIFSNTKLHQ